MALGLPHFCPIVPPSLITLGVQFLTLGGGDPKLANLIPLIR